MVNILLGCTGSVAAIKLPILVQCLKEAVENCDVRIVTTENAKHFFNSDNCGAEVFEDSREWKTWSKKGDPILHIDLRNWSDIFLIAPLDANTLGKLAYGLCDNLLTCIVRAWDINNKRLFFCPAMNTMMWNHPATNANINILKSWGYIEILPIAKQLACGEEGIGAMAEVTDIVKHVQEGLLTRKSQG